MSYQQIVESGHKLTFTSNVQLVSQQVRNPLRDAVTIVPATGEAQDIADLIGSLDAMPANSYDRRNPENVPQRTRRWLVLPDPGIETGQYITKHEKFAQAMDSSSQLLLTHMRAMERGIADLILGVQKQPDKSFKVSGGGIMGSVLEGKTPSSAAKALPAGNYIAADFGNAGTDHGLTIEKLRAATEAMELEDFGLETDDEIHSMLTPKQKTDLLNLALETKTNLNAFQLQQIETGRPTTLLGITWHFSNRVPKNSSGNRLIPLWSKANIVCGMWQDVQGNMWNDTGAKNLPYMHADAFADAGRIEDEGVRIIECAEP